jgi:hypothetical protein
MSPGPTNSLARPAGRAECLHHFGVRLDRDQAVAVAGRDAGRALAGGSDRHRHPLLRQVVQLGRVRREVLALVVDEAAVEQLAAALSRRAGCLIAGPRVSGT